MTPEERLEVLERIEEIQHDTNAVTVQIGHVADNNQVKHNSIYVKDAPASVINTLRDEGYSVAVDERGARIYDHR